jgi:hypothetical protein
MRSGRVAASNGLDDERLVVCVCVRVCACVSFGCVHDGCVHDVHYVLEHSYVRIIRWCKEKYFRQLPT